MPTDPDDVLSRVTHLVRTRRSMLAALARAEGARPEDAVDCVQEGFCKLLGLAREGKLPEDTDASAALLAGIVRNVARNRRRRHDRAREHVDVDAHPHPAGDLPPTDEALAQAETHVRLRLCVEELCEIQKAVVTLRMLEELPGEDVAEALGITPGYVAVLLHRAKQSLQACMTTGA